MQIARVLIRDIGLMNFRIFSTTILIKALSVMILFLSQVVLARLLTIEEFGIYGYVMSLSTVALFFVVCGVDKFSIKKLPALYESSNKEDFSQKYFELITIVVINFVVVSPVVFFILYIKYFNSIQDVGVVCIVGILILLFSALSRYGAAVSKSIRRILFSEFLLNFIRPLLLLSFVGLLWVFGIHLNIVNVLSSILVSYFLIFLYGFYVNQTVVGKTALFGRFNLFSTYKELIPYGLIGLGLPLLSNIDILLLGLFEEDKDIAMYVASSKLVNMILIGLVSANMIIAPRLSALFMNNKISELNRLLRKNNKFILGATIVPVLAIFLFAENILWLFGEAYIEASLFLKLLTIGQLFNVFCGPVNIMCMMCGQQKLAALLLFICCLLEAVLCIFLIPLQGVIGACIANIAAFGLFNGLLLLVVKKKIGINPSLTNILAKY